MKNKASISLFYISLLNVVIAFLAIVATPVHAQVSQTDMPQNASAKRYASGWVCDQGYREVKGACIAVVVPANGYATTASYGRGWDCSRGYLQSGEACTQLVLPANAYLNSTRGDSWKCDRGFRKSDETCVAIEVPANGYLSDVSYGPGWTCVRGYRATADKCVAVVLPENAHLDYSGNDWACNPPYKKRIAGCRLD